ncbi:hypothetical protein K450DRAFT_231564 [Umbelopsis ramanniana AG]|uniref:Uncharacterized protein n=1 Tax=Umbelopsis ramanniana AG TaxID=1314678 RepID=A0AAD5EED0_UMBRA|nr:uncharacterized protein K450DRAFT_231564 [Umbelopsis ramanniana AG]KAI8581495.1 hypothetical protein K450DRAFT_231564 [Umbelopsis ramanniana AG]
MDRPQKRIIDKVAIFFQRKWWRRQGQQSELAVVLVPETNSPAPSPPAHRQTNSDSPKQSPIREQDSAVSVSSAEKPVILHSTSNEDHVNTPPVTIKRTSSPAKNLTVHEQPPVPPPKTKSIRRFTTLKASLPRTKSTVRGSRALSSPEHDPDSDKVSDILRGVDSVKLKSKPSTGRARSILRSRRVGHKKLHSKTASHAAAKLNECSFRNITVAEIKDLQHSLQNGDGDWEEAFLKAGGYEALNFMLWEIASSINRQSLDDLLREIANCYKTLLVHTAGAKAVFANLQPIYIIRDLLFGVPGGEKMESFNVGTRLALLQVLNQLQLADDVALHEDTGNGYRLMYELLSDEPSQKNGSSSSIKSKKSAASLVNRSFPLRHYTSSQSMRSSSEPPRFNCWMRELATTVEQSVKPASFLADVLDYQFDIQKPNTECSNDILQQSIEAQQDDGHSSTTDTDQHDTIALNDVNGQSMLAALIDNTAILYLNTHLRLMKKIIEVPALKQSSQYGILEQGNVRRQFFKCGFNDIATLLLACPYPALKNTYINQLTPLLPPTH